MRFMKVFYFLIFSLFCLSVYAEDSIPKRDTVSLFVSHYNTYKIDSLQLKKHREINAVNYILAETSSINTINSPTFSTLPNISFRNKGNAIFSWNNVPITSFVPEINMFNIDRIDLYPEALDNGSIYSMGLVNLTSIKPQLNQPLKISYELNLVGGTINFDTYSDDKKVNDFYDGNYISNNIALSYGKNKYSLRVSYSNALNKMDYYLYPSSINETSIKNQYNSVNIDLFSNINSRLSVNTNIFYLYKTINSSSNTDNVLGYYTKEGKSVENSLFSNLSFILNVSESLNLKSQISSIINNNNLLEADYKRNMPLYANIELEKNVRITEKTKLNFDLGYKHLFIDNKESNNEEKNTIQNLYLSSQLNFNDIFQTGAKVIQEYNNNPSIKHTFFTTYSLNGNINLHRIFNLNEKLISVSLYTNLYSTDISNDNTTLARSFECGVVSSFINNRISIGYVYFKDWMKNYNLTLISTYDKSTKINNVQNNGYEIRCSARIIEKKNIAWIFKGNLGMFDNDYIEPKTNSYDDYFNIFPKTKYSLQSNLRIRNLSLCILTDGLLKKKVSEEYYATYYIGGEPYRYYFYKLKNHNIFNLRQINITYSLSEKATRLLKVDKLEFSLYFKNLYSEPSYNFNKYDLAGTIGRRVIGFNLQIGFC